MIQPSVPDPRVPDRWCGSRFTHATQLYLDHYGHMLALARKYGDLVPFLIFHQPCYLVNHPDLIHTMLVQLDDKIRKQRRNSSYIERVLRRGMLTNEGPGWRRNRLAIQSLVRSERMEHYASIAAQMTYEEIAKWQPGQPVNLQPALGSILMRTIASSLFGRDSGDQSISWFHASELLADRQMQEVVQFFSFPDWVPLPAQLRKRTAKRTIRQAAQFLIRPGPHGELSEFVEVLQSAWEDRPAHVQEIVLCETMTFILAGMHTTAAATEWMLLEVTRHPEVQDAAIREVQAALERETTQPSDLGSLPYLNQIAQESVRLHPPIWALLAREAAEDFELGGVKIAKGSWIFVYPKIVHRDARWFPKPERFDPARFAPAAIDSIPNNAYFPFGMGPHRCIGAALAQTILPTVLGTMLAHYRLEPARDLDSIAPQYSTVMHPRGGVWVRPVAHAQHADRLTASRRSGLPDAKPLPRELP